MGKRGEGWTLAGLHYAIAQPLICYVSILSTAQPLLLNILGPNLEFLPKFPQPLPRLPSHPLLHTLSRQCVSSLPFSKSPYHPLLNPTPTDLNPRSNPSPSCQKICIPTQYTLIPQIEKPTLNHRNQERRDFVSWVFEGERRESVGMGVR